VSWLVLARDVLLAPAGRERSFSAMMAAALRSLCLRDPCIRDLSPAPQEPLHGPESGGRRVTANSFRLKGRNPWCDLSIAQQGSLCNQS
jgi:hypothetical protein